MFENIVSIQISIDFFHDQNYTEFDNILINCDFNARSGSLLDFIQNDSLSSENKYHGSEIMCYIPDINLDQDVRWTRT